MYPYPIIFGLTLYEILLLVGVIACMIFIRVLSDERHMRASWQNLILFNAVGAVIFGYGSAVLFQGFYNFMADGVFELTTGTGATFYGGLIGGTVIFIIIYFLTGHFLFKDGYHLHHFRDVSDMAAPCIAVAHGFGRLGCLMAGCCHGPETDAWYGIKMLNHGEWVKQTPVQLFEAIFLFALAGLTFLLFRKGKKYLLPLYMSTYGAWRIIAEIMRSDDRGATVVSFLTPSQLISVLLIVGSVVLFAAEWYMDHREGKKNGAADKSNYAKELHGQAPEGDTTDSEVQDA